LQKTTSNQETSAVGSSVVLETNLESVTSKLSRFSGSKNAVSIDKRVSNLANDLAVGETNDKTVLWRLVLVFVLGTKTLALAVVRLSLAAATKLDLITRIVRLALLNFDKNLTKE
jgi:hypothetical protein